MKRSIGLGAAGILAGVLAGGPGFSSAQSGPAWPTFHDNAQRSGVSTVSGPTTNTAENTWQLPRAVEGPVAVDSSNVAYVGDDNGSVYALDPSKPAAPKWSYSAGAQVVAGPTLSSDGSKLFDGAMNGNVFALNAGTGAQIWQKNVGGQVQGSPVLSPDGATLYVNTANGSVQALNTSDGSQKWKTSLGAGIPGSLALNPDGTIVYAAASNAEIYAIPAGGPSSTATTTVFYLDGAPLGSPAVDSNGNIYVTTNLGSLMAFAAGSNTPIWTWRINPIVPAQSTPAIWNGLVIYGANNGHLYGINQTSGQAVFTGTASGPITSSPAVAAGNSTIYVGSDDGNVYAFSGSSGNRVWSRATGLTVSSSPALGPDGSLWAASQSGIVYRFHALPVISPPPSGSTSTPGPSPTPSPTTTATVPTGTLTVSLVSSVAPGGKQTIKIKSSANTAITIRVQYPNGDRQSKTLTTNASGSATYSYTQSASKITHSKSVASVTVAGAGLTKTARYTIRFGKIDASAEPRTQRTGKNESIYVHAGKRWKVQIVLLFPKGRAKVYQKTTGSNGWTKVTYKVGKGLTKEKNHTVSVNASTRGRHPNYITRTSFTIK